MGAPIVPKTSMTLTTMSPGRRVSGQPWKPAYSGKEVVSSPGKEAGKQREDTCNMFRGVCVLVSSGQAPEVPSNLETVILSGMNS